MPALALGIGYKSGVFPAWREIPVTKLEFCNRNSTVQIYCAMLNEHNPL